MNKKVPLFSKAESIEQIAVQEAEQREQEAKHLEQRMQQLNRDAKALEEEKNKHAISNHINKKWKVTFTKKPSK